jgi:putative RNA 2'-phosphotransferase
MTDPELIERITRSLAYMLRHQPEAFDLELDSYGFADLEDVVHALNERLGEPVEEEDVREAVRSGDRPRYEIDGDRIRALYGHSIPVEPGPSSKPPEYLFVAIPASELERARRFGLRGGRRRFLHLAITKDDAAESGRRGSVSYAVLVIHALDAWEEGVSFYDRTALWLAEEIPTHLIEVEGTYDDGSEPERGLEGPRERSYGYERHGQGRGAQPSGHGHHSQGGRAHGEGRGRRRRRGGRGRDRHTGERFEGGAHPVRALEAPGGHAERERTGRSADSGGWGSEPRREFSPREDQGRERASQAPRDDRRPERRDERRDHRPDERRGRDESREARQPRPEPVRGGGAVTESLSRERREEPPRRERASSSASPGGFGAGLEGEDSRSERGARQAPPPPRPAPPPPRQEPPSDRPRFGAGL